MPAVSLKEYAAAIKRSGLLSADDVKQHYESFRASVSDSEKATNAELFASYLQSASLLTDWQNSNLLNGKYRGLVFGKFVMLRLLGVGGMGRVFLAQDQMLRRQVALKVLPKQSSENESVLQRFHREAQALARLDHPNIVRVHDVDSRDNTHYIVMEYVKGIDLRDLVQEQGPLSDETVADYARQVATGLSHAHANHLIHRDIKPANLLLDDKGTVKILDLGLALLQSDEDGSITADPTLAIGTADYIAPEQALNSHNIDQRTDIYSLGCTLYFLLTGQPPFATGTNSQRLLAHQVETAEPVNDVRSQKELPVANEALVAICARMMAKNPEARFHDCDELADALEAYVSTGQWTDSSTETEASELCLPEASLPTAAPQKPKKVVVKGRRNASAISKHKAKTANSSTSDTDSMGSSVTTSEQDAVRITRHDAPNNDGSKSGKKTRKRHSKSQPRSKSKSRKKKKPVALIAIVGCLLLAAVGMAAYVFSNRNNASSSATGTYYVVGDNTTYHCDDCRFVKGKSNVSVASSDQISSGHLQACGICKPD